MTFKPTDYKLMNCADGRIFEDAGWTLSDPQSKTPSLVRAVYANRKFEVRDDLDGFYRFANWLPIKRTLSNSCPPVTYRSKGLADLLKLDNLFITFSGYYPEIGAFMQTCSFKETEAYSVCARLPRDEERVLVVASAGNTARAFAKVCSDNGIPLLLSIPYDNIHALWFDKSLDDCVKIMAAPAGADYFDAIALADKVCESGRFLAEGGAKNIARRDGMGTTILSAVEKIGQIPDAYFQAIGSGTGTIAVWENNLRLIADGRFGTKKMKLYPSQNIPFTIMYDSWKAASRDLLPLTPEDAREQASIIKAKVLSNRKPPYSIAGGVYDALTDTGGDIYNVSNSEIDLWKAKFLELEGTDIYSAAAVAVSSLDKAVKEGRVGREDIIMLNITGGGEAFAKSSKDVVYEEPDIVLDPSLGSAEIIRRIEELF